MTFAFGIAAYLLVGSLVVAAWNYYDPWMPAVCLFIIVAKAGRALRDRRDARHEQRLRAADETERILRDEGLS